MASTSLRPNHYKYDVFLSFRGEDTRYSFTDHLYQALVRSRLATFRDNDEIYKGQQLKPEIDKAIRQSRASIIVLSQNYAKSRWCLDELVLILEQRWNYNHYFLPVFYHVDPSDVRNQRRSFAVEANEGVEGSKWTEVNVNRWKEALTDVASLTGMVVEGPESNFIAEIVDTVDCKLDLKLVSTPTHLTGIENRAEGINSWLKNEESNAEFLAICGMGGSGKTTLAQYIYNLNKHNFECSSFVQEIGKHCQQPLGLLGLQKQLLRDLLGGKNMKISNSEVTSKIEEIIRMKRVLIVLDDIDEHDEFAALLGTKTFRTQSKIITTTRLLNIHEWFGSASWSCRLYKIELLNDDESLELLSCHAFGSKIPMDGFEELAIDLARYCKGNPLALKVLGSSLFVSSKDPRERNSVMEIWTSSMNSLASLKGDPDFKIQCILQKSYDSLPRDSHRKLFLHIARFFVGEYEDDVVRMLEHDWRVKAGIMTLVNRCLLTVSPNKKLMMHQLLQVMGRKIAREEFNDPVERSIVWHDDEAYRMFRKGGGSNTIEGLTLDILKLKEVTESLALKTVSLTNMNKSKPFELTESGTYERFPELNVTSVYRSSTTSACRFSFAEILSATKDFDDELVIGQGGFGKVYRGQICSEEIVRIVAIKRLHSMSNQGALEFRTEIEVLSKLRHCHLVSLIGYCDDNMEMILVYEYMANGTLYDQLHKAGTSLKWVQRMKVAIGVGRGLDYLHTSFGTQHGVIHRDVKSSNILLDENLEARISDFGLSKIFQTDHLSPDVETSVKGTFGYMDPEYFNTRKLTRKTDVYAFGVVLFELLSGRRAIDQRNGEDQYNLASWAQKCVKERKLDKLTDSNIRGTISPKSLRRFSQIADRCLHNASRRPNMTEIVASLQDILELQEKYDDSPKGFSSKMNKYFSF